MAEFMTMNHIPLDQYDLIDIPDLPHDPPFMLRVTDLKQYLYCPRILYYQTLLPKVRPTTFKMEEGQRQHERIIKNEQRRTLRLYGLPNGERFFNVPLYAPALHLSGEVDMVIQTETELIPVDYKNSKRVNPNHRLQLMAYGYMLAHADPKSDLTVKRGFIYLIPTRKAVEVKFTPSLQKRLENTIQLMYNMVQKQQMPPPTNQIAKCVDCEFRRFCNDVL
ncbi:MAG: CRISPR-associated protein Cas4 [Gammaproteobacteria bacterium]|nr:MAG: CRISPR-associated protein Cas4 [Gammaproteobacteria bacterium]